MKILKNVWTWVVAALAAAVLVIKSLVNKNNSLEAELDLKETEVKSNEIDSKLKANKKDYKDLEQKKSDLKKKDPNLNVSDLSPEEIEAYWKDSE